MDGMWELFFATGLPQAYLAARREKPQAVLNRPCRPETGRPFLRCLHRGSETGARSDWSGPIVHKRSV